MFCSLVTPDKFLQIKAARKVAYHTRIDLESSAHVPPFIRELPYFSTVILFNDLQVDCLKSPASGVWTFVTLFLLRCFCQPSVAYLSSAQLSI